MRRIFFKIFEKSDFSVTHNPYMIVADNTVVVRNQSEHSALVQILKASADQKMGKSRISLKDAVGHPYGSLFELINRK